MFSATVAPFWTLFHGKDEHIELQDSQAHLHSTSTQHTHNQSSLPALILVSKHACE